MNHFQIRGYRDVQLIERLQIILNVIGTDKLYHFKTEICVRLTPYHFQCDGGQTKHNNTNILCLIMKRSKVM